MKALVFSLVAVSVFMLGSVAHSQAPGVPQTTLQRLEALRAKNKELLDRQAETLKKLDEMEQQAEQVKFLGKRS